MQWRSVRSGITLGPLHGDDGEVLERNAMAALAEAGKRNTRTHTFGEHLRGLTARRLELEHDLRRAIDQQEFELHYQPKFETLSRRMVGAEALLRWRHPRTGLVSPDVFIPVLEETGLIVPVGRWVLGQALDTALRWRQEYHPSLRITVNVSACELRHTDFLDYCRTLLEPHLVDQPIDIELTESQLMDDVEHCMYLLEGSRPRLPCGDRRLRHRLLVAQLPGATAGGRSQDRQVIRRAADAESGNDGPGHQHHYAGPFAVAHRDRRRRGRGGAGETASTAALRHAARLSAGRPLPADEFEEQFLAIA